MTQKEFEQLSIALKNLERSIQDSIENYTQELIKIIEK